MAVMDDSALLQYLVGKYGLTDLVEMLRSTAGRGRLVFGISSQPRLTLPEIDPDLEVTKPDAFASHVPVSVDVNPSPISFSDASSVNGSLYSTCSEASAHKTPNTSAPTVRHLRARSAGRKVLSKLPNARSQTKPAYPVPAKRKATFECPFCAERCITVEISRKNDLKRHFVEFHANKALWPCPVRGCQMMFDWKSAYIAHLRTAHSGMGPPPQNIMVDTCSQVVFGCGFNNCKRVFEAVSDTDADQKLHDYFAHVAEHFEDGLTHKDWSFSTRFRNLMRQELVEDAWKQRKKSLQQNTSWQPLSSFTLRKMLECRHIPDIAIFVQWATTLGSMGYSNPRTPQPKLPPQFMIPVKQSCPLAQVDHRRDRSFLSISSPPQNVLPEDLPTPAPQYNGITSSPGLNHAYLTSSAHADGLPSTGPWMDAVHPAFQSSLPVDPLMSSVSMAGICQASYIEDNATSTPETSYDLWPDITFDPTFNTQFELPIVVQNDGEICKPEPFQASRPPTPMSLTYSMSTVSNVSTKENKASDMPAYRFQFNMH